MIMLVCYANPPLPSLPRVLKKTTYSLSLITNHHPIVQLCTNTESGQYYSTIRLDTTYTVNSSGMAAYKQLLNY